MSPIHSLHRQSSKFPLVVFSRYCENSHSKRKPVSSVKELVIFWCLSLPVGVSTGENGVEVGSVFVYHRHSMGSCGLRSGPLQGGPARKSLSLSFSRVEGFSINLDLSLSASSYLILFDQIQLLLELLLLLSLLLFSCFGCRIFLVILSHFLLWKNKKN